MSNMARVKVMNVNSTLCCIRCFSNFSADVDYNAFTNNAYAYAYTAHG